MSCNPAVGGLAKGQIAREVDALGGLMGRAIDSTGIQFRLLNRSKGPAVQSPRAQADKHRYAAWVRRALEQTENLEIIEKTAAEILTEKGRVSAVVCADGSRYQAKTVIVATGTFLRGLMHVGTRQSSGGRLGELGRLGLEMGRLKTGTPPRLDASGVDFDRLQIQQGDSRPSPFSFMTDRIDREQTPCWITYTNEKIHNLLTDNLDRAPLYSGQIKSIGPRYCPSIETKVVRFPDKKRHQVFLEPEEQEASVIYCNGISTSVPEDVQRRMLALLPGTENAKIVHYGYAIEYDYCPPVQLQSSLETRRISGLFLAGQINGTSGYEEAAGQGILAGINAALKIQKRDPVVLGRDQAYIGVMIDDLLTKGIDEPYRMFTSRAEYRLSLRADNADRRLTQTGKAAGLADRERWARFQAKLADIGRLSDYLHTTRSDGLSLWEQLRKPNHPLLSTLGNRPDIEKMNLHDDVIQAVTIDARYEGYLAKQAKLVADLRSLEGRKIPAELDYDRIEHLKSEARQKLSAFRPATLAQAARISGITPADITVIQIHLKKYC
jgi:tRNA uridine 5-carboxymethylaminomethyl modification enzyme